MAGSNATIEQVPFRMEKTIFQIMPQESVLAWLHLDPKWNQ